MRNVERMINDLQLRVSRELPESFDLQIREIQKLNELSEGTGRGNDRWFYLICNAWLFGAACGLDYYESQEGLKERLERGQRYK